jgi:hypothetical protein
MKSRFMLMLIFLVLMKTACPQDNFQMTYGTRFNDEIVKTVHFDDNSSICFMNKLDSDLSAISVFKIDADGSILWSKATSFHNSVQTAVLTSDGNIAFAGKITKANPYGWQYTKALIVKMDTAGNVLWNKIIGFGINAEATDILELPDNSLFVTGVGINTGVNQRAVLGIRLDKYGNVLQASSYIQGVYNESMDAVYCHDSTLMIIGADRNLESRIQIIDIDLNGEVQWNKVLYSDKYPQYNIANAICKDSRNNYYITGSADNGILCMKLNADFEPLWSKKYGNPSGLVPEGKDIICVNDSLIVLTAAINDGDAFHLAPSSDIITMGINSLGDTLWTVITGSLSDDSPKALYQLSDTSFRISGKTYGFSIAGNYDGYLFNVESPGNSSNCNYITLPFLTDTVEFLISDSIATGERPVANDTVIVWSADTIVVHNACECFPPHASFYTLDMPGPSITVYNGSTWAKQWEWVVSDGYRSDDFSLEYFLQSNLNICLNVENECGTDQYCEDFIPFVADEDISRFSIDAYPIPSTERVYFQFGGLKGNPDIYIMDANGKRVATYPGYKQNSLIISKNETGTGLFVVLFTLNHKVVAAKKIIFE